MVAEPAGRNAVTMMRVATRAEIATDIHMFELVGPDGAELPAFTPGAHIPLTVPGGAERKYSLINSPDERHRYVIAVKAERDGRGGSVSLIERVKAGDVIAVGAPRNDFALKGNPASYLFIAGGIGITPIRSMILGLMRTGAKPFTLYYFTRSPEVMAFRDEFSAPDFRGTVVLHHDAGDPAKVFDLWPVLENPKGAHVYCCGPRVLMQSVRDMTGHWSSSAVHFEDFGANKAKPEDNSAFTVTLARSGATLVVPINKSILEVLREAGITVASSCESGTCGTCRTGLVAGLVDYRDLVLGEHERETAIMICVSRAKGADLVLDL